MKGEDDKTLALKALFPLKPWFYQWYYHGCPAYVDKTFTELGGAVSEILNGQPCQSEGSFVTLDQWDAQQAMVRCDIAMHCALVLIAWLLTRDPPLHGAEWSLWGSEKLRHASLWNCDLRNSGRGTLSSPLIGQWPGPRLLIGWWSWFLGTPRGGVRCLNVMTRQYSIVFRDSTQ